MKPAFSNAKYEATGETRKQGNVTLHRIRLLTKIETFEVGTFGGWIENENNLAVGGNAWVDGDAQVYGNARVGGNAQVYGDALIYGDARVYGNARVTQRIPYATRSDGYVFTVVSTHEGPRVIAGCRYFTFEEAREHWNQTRGGTPLGDESLALVDFLERIAVIRGF